jgi:hypothetical protein
MTLEETIYKDAFDLLQTIEGITLTLHLYGLSNSGRYGTFKMAH